MNWIYITSNEFLVLHVLLLAGYISGIYGTSCPDSCQCTHTPESKNNLSIYRFGDSKITLLFNYTSDRRTIQVLCQGTNYTCAGIPEYETQNHFPSIIINRCPASIMSCFKRTRHRYWKFQHIELYKAIGPYKVEDFEYFDQINTINIYLNDADNSIPTDVINSMKALTIVEIIGGQLKLYSNVFNQTHINLIILNGNNIDTIPANAFNGLTGLDEIRIFNSTIATISPYAFRGLNIRELTVIVQNNRIALQLDSEIFTNLPATIKNITMYDCKIKYLPNKSLSKNLRSIDFGANSIETLPPKLFKNVVAMKYIKFNNNNIQILPKGYFAKVKDLVKIDLSFNKIEIWTSDLLARNSPLRILNLRHNNIKHIDLTIFNETNLRNLDMSYNKLQRMTGNELALWRIRTLNLSYNELTAFEDWFTNLSHLENLDLMGNNIQVFKESSLHNFSSKVTIDLRNNSITQIIRDIPHSSTLFRAKSDITLFISDNPIECDCVVATILNEWKTFDILADFTDITCIGARKLSDIDTHLLCSKKTHDIIVLTGTSFFGTLTGIIILTTIYAKRNIFWNFIKKPFNKDTEKLTPYELKEDALKEFDVFLSFAHEDSDFVVDLFLPKLEIEFYQKVCVHYRDWIVGQRIPDQIIKSVENSRLTIAILTEHFLQSEWSYLELRTAHHLGLQVAKRKVIVIILDENVLKHEKYRDEIKSFVISNTSLMWRDTKFWEKLQKLLPRQGRK